jgi:dephospho-CoA kinase
MKRVLLTGMSGTGKSSVLRRLAELGFRTVDTDYNDLTVEVRSASGASGRLWREDRIEQILSATDADLLFISGTCRNQVKFYTRFDYIVLLSAPASVLVERLTTRSSNPYGKSPEEITETLRLIEAVEPLLRRAATLELDTTAPLDFIVDVILRHVAG